MFGPHTWVSEAPVDLPPQSGIRVLTTERLALRLITEEDAAFYLQLINEPGWLRYIGDKGVRSVDAARAALLAGPIAQQQQRGFGVYVIELLATGTPIGMSSLVKRDALPDVDIGYALLEAHWGYGYALEATRAVIVHSHEVLKLPRLLAITSPDHTVSMALLEKAGLRYERVITWAKGGEVRLYSIDLPSCNPLQSHDKDQQIGQITGAVADQDHDHDHDHDQDQDRGPGDHSRAASAA